MPKSGLNVALKGLDDIFSTEESRQEEQREQVQQIPVSELFPFKNHPFKVLDDDSMTRTVESISQFGVLAPLIARPRPEGGYEIISGHRRKHAAELANLDTVPVIVRNMEDDAATILMVDSNLQREHILPSERAFAYKMKLDAIKNQGARSDLTSSQVGTKLRADEKVAKVNGSQVQVTGVGSCEIVITASETDQYYQTEERVRIRVEKGQQTITVPVTEYHKYLSDKNFKVTASIEKPGDGKLVFLANENDVLEVTEDGYVTILGTGTTQIYAVAKASDNFVRQVSDAITVTVEEDPKPQPKPDDDQNQNGSGDQNQQNTASVKKAVIRKVQPKKAQVKVTWKKQAAAGSYEIRYALKKNMKNAKTVKVNGKKSSITIKKLKSGKRYYIQVRAVKKNGTAVKKGAWSTKKSVRVK